MTAYTTAEAAPIRSARAGAGAAPTVEEARIGSWRLVRRLAQGDWADIFAARPARVPASREAAYAIKTLSAERTQDPLALACLRREAAVGREVRHPRLIHLLAEHLQAPPYYVVMPCLAGTSLDVFLQRRGLSITMSLCIARQVAEALAALHARGWIHGDIKPGNIMVSPSGHATLIDLGLARRLDEPRGFANQELRGAAAYLPPEAFTSAYPLDGRSDLYSLGVVLFELLSGRRPFEAASVAELAAAHLATPPPDLRQLRPMLPREVVCLVERLLAKQPLRRPHSAEELVARLIALEIATFGDRW